MMTMQGSELKAIRQSTGLTQEAFARGIGMSRKAVIEMETGKAPIEPRTAMAANALLTGAILPLRVTTGKFGPKFVVIATEATVGGAGRAHHVLTPAYDTAEDAEAAALAYAEINGCPYMAKR